MTPLRLFLLVLSVVVAVPLVLFVSFAAWWSWTFRPYRLASLAVGETRVDIAAQADQDITGVCLDYEVRDRAGLVVEPRFLGVQHDRRARFDVLALRGGSLVAVYEAKHPHALVIVYDAQTGECWPGGNACEEEAANEIRLTARVRELTGDAAYELTGYSDNNPNASP